MVEEIRGDHMNQEQAKSILKEIIQIKSVNPPGNETEVAKKLKSLSC
ncbi:hypothetical protein CV093_20680 [Oceanobacillus sp. 143]|nr:hypothetical protein CV093_20680 [Oceanobacillus sp. 143]